MSKMFLMPTPEGLKPMVTWSPFSGCNFQCSYCWSRDLVENGRLKRSLKYQHGFAPTFHPNELHKTFKPGVFCFVSSMGDVSFASRGELLQVLEVIRRFPETSFLLCTKNPAFYLGYEDQLPPNVYLEATIESNRHYPDITRAPAPFDRYRALAIVNSTRKFLSVEPILDFDLEMLVDWVLKISPRILEIGADNYKHNLPEPSWEKVEAFMQAIRRYVPTVIEKPGLGRLKINKTTKVKEAGKG